MQNRCAQYGESSRSSKKKEKQMSKKHFYDDLNGHGNTKYNGRELQNKNIFPVLDFKFYLNLLVGFKVCTRSSNVLIL